MPDTPPKKLRIKEIREGKVQEAKKLRLPFETVKQIDRLVAQKLR